MTDTQLCPCRYNHTCPVVRQFLQRQLGTFEMACETFVAITARQSFHPEPIETEDAPF